MANRPFTKEEKALMAACYYVYFNKSPETGFVRAVGPLYKAGLYLLRRGLVMRGDFENIIDKTKLVGFRANDGLIDIVNDEWSDAEFTASIEHAELLINGRKLAKAATP